MVDAVLEARALRPAAVGAVFEARLAIGGRVVRVVALGPGPRGASAGDGSEAMKAKRTLRWPGRSFAVAAGADRRRRRRRRWQQEEDARGSRGKATPPEEALKAYIERVRAQQAAEVRTPGSIWSPEGRLVRLGTDAKAVRLHDVVSIVVSESLAASTDGQVKNSRASSANSGLTSLFGKLKSLQQSCRTCWARPPPRG